MQLALGVSAGSTSQVNPVRHDLKDLTLVLHLIIRPIRFLKRGPESLPTPLLMQDKIVP